MSECLKSFALQNKLTLDEAICSKNLAILSCDSYIQHRIFDDCTAELRQLYSSAACHNTTDDSYCRIHYNVNLLISGHQEESDLIECLLLNKGDIKAARGFLHYGASCHKSTKLTDEYLKLKDFHKKGACPDEYNAGIGQYQLKYSDGTHCKQFVEMYDKYCVDTDI